MKARIKLMIILQTGCAKKKNEAGCLKENNQ